jgi:DNA-binding Lrp family transcriptional regulator
MATATASKDISIAYKVYHMPLTFLTRHAREEYCISGASEGQQLTVVEQRVLDEIIKDPEFISKKLAKKTKISINTLKKIINDLKKKKILLAFQTIIQKEALGIQHFKLYLSFPFSVKNKLKVIELLKSNPNIIYITETGYNFDLECEIYTFDYKTLEDIIRNLKTAYPFQRIVISQMKSEEKLS